MYRVGILGEKASDPSEARLWQAFRSGLQERGWIEGKNLLIESRWHEGNQLPELAADLVRLNVDLIVTRGSIYVQALKEATSSIPVIFTMHADPERTGHVASLARPGGNITGLSIQMTDLNVKGLEILISAVPKAKRIAVLGSPDMPSYAPSVKALQEAARPFQLQLRTVVARTGAVKLRRDEMEVAARSLGVRLQFLAVTSVEDLEAAFDSAAKAHAEGLVMLPSPLFAFNERLIAELALRRQLPSIFWRHWYAEAGGLLAYGPDFRDQWRRTGILVAKVLKGVRPADLPVEQADRFRLVINLKTAKALGLTIPQSLLIRADEVIQ